MQTDNRPCIFCNEAHWPTRCGKNLKERRAIIAELRRAIIERCTASARNCNRCERRNKIHKSTESRNIQLDSNRKHRNCHHSMRKHVWKHNTEDRDSLRDRPGWLRSQNLPVRQQRKPQVLGAQFNFKESKSKTQTGRESSIRRFQQEEETPTEETNLMELKVRVTWEGAPIVNLYVFESEYIANMGPYIKTRFAEELWLKSETIGGRQVRQNSVKRRATIRNSGSNRSD